MVARMMAHRMRSTVALVLLLAVGLCGATTVRIENGQASVASSSGLHGAFAKLEAGSQLDTILISRDVLVDNFTFSPLLKISGEEVQVTSAPGATLGFDRTRTLLILSDGTRLSFRNMTIVMAGEWDAAADLFLGLFDVRPSSKVVFQGVTLGLETLSWFKVRSDLIKNEMASTESNDNLFTIKELETEAFIARDVVLRQQEQDQEVDSLGLPTLTEFQVINGLELVHALRRAVEGGGLGVEITLLEDVEIKEEHMEGLGLITIQNEVVIQSQGGTHRKMEIDRALSNGGLAEIVPGGQLIYRNVVVEYSQTLCGRVCLPTTNTAITYSENGFDCGMSLIDSSIDVPCLYMENLKRAVESELRKPMSNTLPPPLMRVNFSQGDQLLMFIRFVGYGTCFANTTVACNRILVEPLGEAGGSGSNNSQEQRAIIILGAVAAAGILVCICAIFLFPNMCFKRWLKKRRQKASVDSMSGSVGAYSDPKGGSVKTYMMGQINGQQLGITDDAVEITEQIASGGYGVVYKGTWKSLPVAIKTVIFQDVADGAGKEKQRAIFEAAISSSIAHQNVVQTYTYSFKQLQTSSALSSIPIRGDSFSRACVDWKLYIVQELCEGGSLRNALKDRVLKSCDTHEKFVKGVLQLALDVAQGLNHLHKHNIVHGDVNTKNVLLRDEASCVGPLSLVAKIADFGLSVKMSYMQSHISNHKAGTPFYMAPEVVQHGVLSKKADVFSYGVVLWEIYHQSCPIQTTGGNGSLQYHEKFPKFPVSCPMLYALLCVVCLSPLPEDRPTFDFILRVLTAIRESIENDKEFLPSKIQKQNLELVQRLNGKTGQELVQFLAELLGEDETGSNPNDNTEEPEHLSESEELNPGPIHTENLPSRRGPKQSLPSIDPSYSMTITLGSREGQSAWTSDSISFSWDRVSSPEPRHANSGSRQKGSLQRPGSGVKFPEVPSVGASILDGMNDDTAFQMKGPLTGIPESPHPHPPPGPPGDHHHRPNFPLRLGPSAPGGQRDMELVHSGSTQRSDTSNGAGAVAGYRQHVREVGLISARSGMGRWSSKEHEEHLAVQQQQHQQQHQQLHHHQHPHQQQHQQQQEQNSEHGAAQNLAHDYLHAQKTSEGLPGTISEDYFSMAQHNSDYYSMSVEELANHSKFPDHEQRHPRGLS